MKIIITPVGTSLMTNYLAEKEDGAFKNQYQRYRHRPASEYALNRDDITRIKSKLERFATGNERASAEIKSISKLSDERSNNLSIHLDA